MTRKRRLAAVLFSDICGFSRMLGEDESRALQILKTNRLMHQTSIADYKGHYVKDLGGGVLAWFESSKRALEFALHIVESAKANGYNLRVGIHEGDMLMESNDIYGHTVNIASRIETAAVGGSIMFSAKVFDTIKNQSELPSKAIGLYQLKNDYQPRLLYALALPSCIVPTKSSVRAQLANIPILKFTLHHQIARFLFQFFPSSSSRGKFIHKLPSERMAKHNGLSIISGKISHI